LRAALGQLERRLVETPDLAGAIPGRPGVRLDRYPARWLARVASERADVRSWLWPLLAITDGSLERLCGEVVLGASVGLVLPGLWWMIVTAGGVDLSISIPLWVGVVLSLGGGLFPILVLTSAAKRAKRSARRVVGSFLNLVVLCLAGGMGIEGALHASASIGEDAVSGRILTSLALAQDAGQPPWDALDNLGRDLGIAELTELAAAVGLAGAEGARIRLTLVAKANSIRRHELAEAESEANSVTERLFLPGVFLLVGFLVFIAYPAVARITAGL
jgi:pilus assembly protein TadC